MVGTQVQSFMEDMPNMHNSNHLLKEMACVCL